MNNIKKNEFYCKQRKGKVTENTCFECFYIKEIADEVAFGFTVCRTMNKVNYDTLSKLHQRFKKDERFRITANHLNNFLLQNNMPIEDLEDALLLIRLNYLK